MFVPEPIACMKYTVKNIRNVPRIFQKHFEFLCVFMNFWEICSFSNKCCLKLPKICNELHVETVLIVRFLAFTGQSAVHYFPRTFLIFLE